MKYFPQFAYSHKAHDDEFFSGKAGFIHSITLAADLKMVANGK